MSGVERVEFEGQFLDEPVLVDVLLERLEELLEAGGDVEELADVQAQLDLITGR